MMKGFNLYYDFMGRLLNDSKLKSAGYKYKTIFITKALNKHNPYLNLSNSL